MESLANHTLFVNLSRQDLTQNVGMTVLADRMKEALNEAGLNQAELARLVGCTRATVNDWTSGRTESLRGPNLMKAAQALGVEPDWLGTGKGPKRRRDVGRPIIAYDHPDELPPGQFEMIPLLDVRVSAGAGVWTEDRANTRYSLAFLNGWLRRNGYRPEDLKLLEVRGDSMEPRIYDGDIVLIDISDTTPRSGRVYAIVYQDWVYLKRLIVRMDGTVEVRSDNPNYPPEMVPRDDQDRLRIVGRCVWAGGDGGL